MVVLKDKVDTEIAWFNAQLADLNTAFIRWLKEDGHDVQDSKHEITKQEEPNGEYTTYEYTLIIDKALKITLVPYGIRIVAAKGRIDVVGPSGSEKLLYLNKEDPVTETSSGSPHGKSVHYIFNNIEEDGWYWYDDSGIRKMFKVTKEVAIALLRSVQ